MEGVERFQCFYDNAGYAAYVVLSLANAPVMLQPSKCWVDSGRGMFFHL